MNKNHLLRAAVALWVLTFVFTAATLPGGTLAKYASRAQGSGTGNIALWSVSDYGPSGKVKYANGSPIAGSDTITRDFTVTNSSDVTADFTIELKIIDSLYPLGVVTNTVIRSAGDAVAGVSCLSGHGGGAGGPWSWRVPAGQTGTFRVTVQQPAPGVPNSTNGPSGEDASKIGAPHAVSKKLSLNFTTVGA